MSTPSRILRLLSFVLALSIAACDGGRPPAGDAGGASSATDGGGSDLPVASAPRAVGSAAPAASDGPPVARPPVAAPAPRTVASSPAAASEGEETSRRPAEAQPATVRTPPAAAADSAEAWTGGLSSKPVISSTGIPRPKTALDKAAEEWQKSASDPTADGNASATVLRLRVTIDGRDELWLTPTHAEWKHLQSDPPTLVEMNGVQWNPQKTPRLANDGKTRFLADGLSFARATISKTKGRAAVKLQEVGEEGVHLLFNDTPKGSDTYELTVTFTLKDKPKDKKK